ncbi:hypothetical protein ABID16_002625 [Rhizobium aquaticum]|uniref:PNPLA domain-containing protein n=1 Tax=Rhizobium aquaticum TaxID=1549636 RepID=A0ABV2J0Q7_9HYPH
MAEIRDGKAVHSDAAVSGRSTALDFGQALKLEHATAGISPAPVRASKAEPAPHEAETVERPTIGLALSGGGIRSAAFCLGVLQSLKANGPFEAIDYLSTVSGGGYTGAALIAGMEREDGKFPFSTEIGGSNQPDNDIADSRAVKEIRDRSRYLMPEGKFDLFISFAIILRGLMVNAVFIGAVPLLAAAITLFLNPHLTSDSATGNLIPEPGWLANHIGSAFWVSKLLAIVFGLYLLFWAIGRSFREQRNADLSDPESRPAKYAGWALLGLIVVFFWELQPPIIHWVSQHFTQSNDQQSVWRSISGIVTGLSAGTGLLAISWRWLMGAIQTASKSFGLGPLMKALTAKAVLFLLAAALPALIYVLYIWLVLAGAADKDGNLVMTSASIKDFAGEGTLVWLSVVVATTLLLAIAVWQIKHGPITQFPPRNGNEARPIGPFFWTAAILATGAVCSYLFYQFLPLAMFQSRLGGGIYLFGAVCLTIIAALFSENANSLHQLYRDRLNRAFAMGAEGGRSFLLSRLNDPFPSGGKRRPYPIINMAVNLQGSKHKNHRGRDADFFVVTPDHVGSDATGYAEVKKFENAEPHIDLAAAAAISGAAVGPEMGRIGVPLLAPTLALLNIRLGYWARNPKYLADEASARKAGIDDWRLSYIFREMFGLLNEDLSKVLLSDGGHIDNLGLYQLLKRRCDVIIVADAEADPAMTFSSLIAVERFARIDLGVRFDLPFADLRDSILKRKKALEAGDLSASSDIWNHAAIGEIHYPESKDEKDPQEEKTGILLYIKSSVTGDEKGYVLDYEQRYPAFPHEPTSDQFFTEEQFEAYRALGFHAADRAWKTTDETPRWQLLMDTLKAKIATALKLAPK